MEQWKDIQGYEGLYQISNTGKLWSVRKQRLMKPYMANGYYKVDIRNENGKRKKEYIHRLVAINYLEKPADKNIVNHKDGNRLNNSVDNLEWCDAKYNNNYGTALINKSRAHTKPFYQFDKEGNLIKRWDNFIEASESVGCNKMNIYNCLKGHTKTAAGYVWKYEYTIELEE